MHHQKFCTPIEDDGANADLGRHVRLEQAIAVLLGQPDAVVDDLLAGHEKFFSQELSIDTTVGLQVLPTAGRW